MKIGQTIYSHRGAVGEVFAILDGQQYLVQTCLRVETEHGEEDVLGPFEVWSQVYERPPVERYAPEITKLVEQQTALYAQLTELRKARESEEREIKARMDRLKRHEKLRRLDDYISGKIQFFVEESWSEVKILAVADAHDCNESKHYRKPRLLTLYGGTDGELNWRLNQYSDHSGSGCTVHPCFTEDEAREKARQVLWEQCAKGPNVRILENLDKLKIEPPSGFRESVQAMIAANKDAEAEKARQQLAALEAQAAALREKIATKPAA